MGEGKYEDGMSHPLEYRGGQTGSTLLLQSLRLVGPQF